MARNTIPNSEYLRTRTDKALEMQLAARISDMQIGVTNEEYFGHPMGTSFRIKEGADAAERIYDEIEMRRDGIAR